MWSETLREDVEALFAPLAVPDIWGRLWCRSVASDPLRSMGIRRPRRARAKRAPRPRTVDPRRLRPDERAAVDAMGALGYHPARIARELGRHERTIRRAL